MPPRVKSTFKPQDEEELATHAEHFTRAYRMRRTLHEVLQRMETGTLVPEYQYTFGPLRSAALTDVQREAVNAVDPAFLVEHLNRSNRGWGEDLRRLEEHCGILSPTDKPANWSIYTLLALEDTYGLILKMLKYDIDHLPVTIDT